MIHSSITDEWMVITDAHVISLDPVEQGGSPGAIAPDEARVRFEAWDTDETFKLGEILFTSPRTKFDCSIVTLRPQPSFLQEFDLPKRLPRADGRQRVYVIGHPRGEALSISLNDNVLLDH
jgi:hypothetical protein